MQSKKIKQEDKEPQKSQPGLRSVVNIGRKINISTAKESLLVLRNLQAEGHTDAS